MFKSAQPKTYYVYVTIKEGLYSVHYTANIGARLSELPIRGWWPIPNLSRTLAVKQFLTDNHYYIGRVIQHFVSGSPKFNKQVHKFVHDTHKELTT